MYFKNYDMLPMATLIICLNLIFLSVSLFENFKTHFVVEMCQENFLLIECGNITMVIPVGWLIWVFDAAFHAFQVCLEIQP